MTEQPLFPLTFSRFFFFMFILLMHILPLLALDNDRFYVIEQADDFPISF